MRNVLPAEARERLRATTPPTYRWWRHVALIVIFQVAGLWVALSALRDVSTFEWTAVPVMFLVVLVGEWASHRYSMHRRVFPRAVYHRHVVEHHGFFTYEDMTIDSLKDLRWVLFPAWALPLLVVSVLPFFAVLLLAGTSNLAWLLILVVLVYYSSYEVFHALAHFPVSRGRFGHWQSRVSRHHRIHHDPALMGRWNFNFVFPIFDTIFATRWRDPGRP